ncbi:MAG: sodium-independent anion transporter [Clostridiales bacterium]|nr:MAG: sodium-independent anion transporter [Clostridiales bacterium]
MIKTYLSDLKREFAGYSIEAFGKDLMAAATVAAVALPLALAFGVSSGVTAASGMITAIVAGVIISAFSGASFQISGPTGAMTAILVTLASKYGVKGIFIAGFIAGVMLIGAGLLRLGRAIYFIPSSVISGFTSGIALIIALGQLDAFLGIATHDDLVLMRVLSYFTMGAVPDFRTIAIGVLTVAIMIIWPKKLAAKVPGSLVALVVALIVNTFLNWDIAVVGEIPKTLLLSERLALGDLFNRQLFDYFMPALSIAALAMIESLLCGASAGKMKNEVMNADREIVAQGIGNLVVPFFGGVPATAAIARTSVAIKSGSVTRLTGILHAVFLLLSMFLLSGFMSKIPLAALAGVLFVTAWRMNDWQSINFIFGHRYKSGMAKFVITMVATVMLDLTQAIVIGVFFSVLLIIVKLTRFNIDVVDVNRNRLVKKGVKVTADIAPGSVKVAYLTGNLFFGVTQKIRELTVGLDNCKVLILSMRGVPMIDVSGIQALLEVVVALQEQGIKVLFCSMQRDVIDELQRANIDLLIDANWAFDNVEAAVVHIQQHPNNI